MTTYNHWNAKVGDKVSIKDGGLRLVLTVSRVSNGDPGLSAANARVVTAHVRLGGYAVDLYPDNLSRYDVRAEPADAIGARYVLCENAVHGAAGHAHTPGCLYPHEVTLPGRLTPAKR